MDNCIELSQNLKIENAYLYGYMLSLEVNYGKEKSWKLILSKGQYHNKRYVKALKDIPKTHDKLGKNRSLQAVHMQAQNRLGPSVERSIIY